jgi:hypothetical protein
MHPDDLKNVPYPADRRKSSVAVVAHRNVDFVELLKFLLARGYGTNAIAMYADVSRSSVRNYIDGTTPLHPQGERMIRLWCEITGNSRDAVPTKREGSQLTVSRF